MKIDKRKNYYIVFDTETIGIDNPYIYDIGYIVTDKKGKIYKKVNHLIREIFTNNKLMEQAYYYNKMPLYLEMLNNNQIDIINFSDIVKEIQQIIKEYNIIGIGAYNVDFDIRALQKTTEFIYPNIFKLDFIKNTNNKQVPQVHKFVKQYILKANIFIFDIWTMSCKSLCKQKTFLTFYKELTQRNNIKSNAEIVYNYVINSNNDNKFIEQHTALSDAEIETQILSRIFKTNTNICSQVFMPFRLIMQ